MRITQLNVENFRGFAEETFEFPERVTVLAGDNGTGKSALLHALAVGAGAALLEIFPEGARSISRADVRVQRYERRGIVTAEPQLPCRVSCAGTLDGQSLTWSRALNRLTGRTDRVDARSIRDCAASLARDVASGGQRALPLVAYYSTARLWRQKRERPKKGALRGPGSRLAGYLDALDEEGSQKVFLTWMRSRTLEALQRGGEPTDLGVVKAALADALPDAWNSLEYDVATDEIVALRIEADAICDRLSLSALSDGQRSMLALVADLAYRCATLNPQLANPLSETGGVVLIDEIDLHLHPRWQRRVLDDLLRVFPRLQVITTTHSPFVIQTRGSGQVVDLNRPEVHVAGGPPNRPMPEDLRVFGLEDVAETALDVKNVRWSRSRERMWEAAREYRRILESGSNDAVSEEARHKLDVLLAEFSDNPAYHAFLVAERATSGFDDPEGQ